AASARPRRARAWRPERPESPRWAGSCAPTPPTRRSAPSSGRRPPRPPPRLRDSRLLDDLVVQVLVAARCGRLFACALVLRPAVLRPVAGGGARLLVALALLADPVEVHDLAHYDHLACTGPPRIAAR